MRAAARQKHQFYGERIKPQTSHANPKLKFTKIHKGGFFPTGDLSQSDLLYFSLFPSETPGGSGFKSQYFIFYVEFEIFDGKALRVCSLECYSNHYHTSTLKE